MLTDCACGHVALKRGWNIKTLKREKENQMERLPYTEILKTNINVTNIDEAVGYIDKYLEQMRGEYICISNVHTTVTAYRDEEYRKVQNGSILNMPDGKPLSIVQKLRGYTQAGRVPGPDLMPAIFKLSEKRGYRHYFYGSTPETIEKLGIRLKEAYPRLQIVGMYSPPFRPMTVEEDAEIIEQINETKPDFIWVGLGAPKQERWMAEHKGKVNGIMLGVGAGFDFHAGTVLRAPRWMQEVCMEWLWRMMQDPKRLFPRYLDTNFSFLYYLMKESKKRKKAEKQVKKYKKANRDRLKIAMIGHKRIPSREGGVEIVVDELSTRMVKLGHQVDAYNRSGYHVSGKKFDEKRGRIYEGVRLITIPTFHNSSLNAVVYSFLATIVVTAKALAGGYDVLHYHAEGPCMMLWIPKLFGIHVVATIHGLDWQRAKWGNFASKMLKQGEKTAARHADEIIVLSKNVQEYFQETYQRHTVYIPNGISRPQHREADLIQERFGLEKDGYILFLARIVPEKGLHYLIDAYRQLDTEKKLVIAGGCSHSQEYMDEIRRICATDHRIVLTGFVQGRELEELYSNAWLFVLPSDIEGMAISLLEAMSYGNCCLVSDIPENTEVIQQCGYTFRKSDTADLKRVLEKLLEHPEMVQEKAKQSADFICSRYNWDDVVERTLKLYRRKSKHEDTDC